MSNKPVVIIGAGCAGLSAAYQLKKKGVDFVVFEGSDRIGGRTGAVYYDPDNPTSYYSVAAVFAEPNSVTTMEYLEEFGLMNHYVPMMPKVYGYWINEQISYLVDNGNLFKAMLGVKGLPPKIVPQGIRFLVNFMKETKKIKGNNLDGLLEDANWTTWDWCVKHGGEEVADKLVAPMIQAMVCGSVRDVCIAHPIALLDFMEGMGQIRGSHATLNNRLYAEIEDKVQLNTKVAEIVIEDRVVKGAKLESGEFIEADYVLSCVDTFDAIDMLPNAPKSIIEPLKTATYSKVWHYVFTFPKRFLPTNCLGLFIPPSAGAKVSAFYDENLHDVAAPAGSSLMHVWVPDWAADEFSQYGDEERIQKVREECARFFPQFKSEGECVCQHYFPRAINLEPVGQFPAIHHMYEVLPQEVKGLHLAGEFAYLIACTEGGYLTGKKEALDIAAKLGK